VLRWSNYATQTKDSGSTNYATRIAADRERIVPMT
jgi:hypothetical protein